MDAIRINPQSVVRLSTIIAKHLPNSRSDR
jgi:hypothetical protein